MQASAPAESSLTSSDRQRLHDVHANDQKRCSSLRSDAYRTCPSAVLDPLNCQSSEQGVKCASPVHRPNSESSVNTSSSPPVVANPCDSPLRRSDARSPRPHELLSLSVTCASSTASSTILPRSTTRQNSSRTQFSSQTQRLSCQSPRSECPTRDPSREERFSSSCRPAAPASMASEHQAPTPSTTILQTSGLPPCHPALCCALLALHMYSLPRIFPTQALRPHSPAQLLSASPLPTFHSLWIALHLITFCSNLLAVHFDAKPFTAFTAVDCKLPSNSSRLAGLACTIPGAAYAILSALQPLTKLLPRVAPLVSVYSSITRAEGNESQVPLQWIAYLEAFALIVAAVFNTAWALSVIAVPLRSTARHFAGVVAVGAGALALSTLLPPQFQLPQLAVLTVVLLCAMRSMQAHVTLLCSMAPYRADRAEYCMRVISIAAVTVAASAAPVLLPPPSPESRTYRGLFDLVCRVLAGLLLPAALDALARSQAAKLRANTLQVAGEARSALLGRQLGELEAMKKQLLLSVTHELNTPLHEVMGCLDALVSAQGSDSLPQAALPFAQTAQTSIFRAARIVRSMMDAVQVEQEQLRLRRARVSMPQVLQHLQAVPWGEAGCGICCLAENEEPAGTSAPAAKLKDHPDHLRSLVVEVQAEAEFVWADADRLLQALYEIVANSFKFSPTSSPVHVRVFAATPGYVRVEVSDSGVGIPADQLPRIWSPFHQVLNESERGAARRSDGLGLGLFLVDQIMRAHGSQLHCTSTVGEGTVVSFDLPALTLAESASAPGFLPPNLPPRTPSAPVLSQTKVSTEPSASSTPRSRSFHAAGTTAAAAVSQPTSSTPRPCPERAPPISFSGLSRSAPSLSGIAPSIALPVPSISSTSVCNATNHSSREPPPSGFSNMSLSSLFVPDGVLSTTATRVPFSALVPRSRASVETSSRHEAFTTMTMSSDRSRTPHSTASLQPPSPPASQCDFVPSLHDTDHGSMQFMPLPTSPILSSPTSDRCTCGGDCDAAKSAVQDAFFASLGFAPSRCIRAGGLLSMPRVELPPTAPHRGFDHAMPNRSSGVSRSTPSFETAAPDRPLPSIPVSSAYCGLTESTSLSRGLDNVLDHICLSSLPQYQQAEQDGSPQPTALEPPRVPVRPLPVPARLSHPPNTDSLPYALPSFAPMASTPTRPRNTDTAPAPSAHSSAPANFSSESDNAVNGEPSLNPRSSRSLSFGSECYKRTPTGRTSAAASIQHRAQEWSAAQERRSNSLSFSRRRALGLNAGMRQSGTGAAGTSQMRASMGGWDNASRASTDSERRSIELCMSVLGTRLGALRNEVRESNTQRGFAALSQASLRTDGESTTMSSVSKDDNDAAGSSAGDPWNTTPTPRPATQSLPKNVIVEDTAEAGEGDTPLKEPPRRAVSTDGLLQRNSAEGSPHAATVMCIDDNSVNQLVISRMLQSAGFRVEKAMSGKEALQKLKAAGNALPDLLIMDVMMPGLSGLDLCREVRRLYPDSVLPTIFVSANSRPEHIVDGFAAGGQDYMAKPINKSELLARVSAQLESKRRIEQAAVGLAQQLLEHQLGMLVDDSVTMESYRATAAE